MKNVEIQKNIANNKDLENNKVYRKLETDLNDLKLYIQNIGTKN